MRVFLDANILFSAARPGSPLREMVLMLARRSACVTNAHARDEAGRNLTAKRSEDEGSFRLLMAQVAVESGMHCPLDIPLTDKDRPILGGAIGCRCTHLLTGDRTHFGAFYGRVLQGVRIVSPRQLAEELVAMGWAEPGAGVGA